MFQSFIIQKHNLICLNKEKYRGTSLAFAAAHEYAHHLQYSKDKFGDLNTLRSELQADCFAGIILATIPGISFNNDEIDKMLKFAFYDLGDNNYDSDNHNGSGENRALAFRSGLAFGRSKGEYKDNYYKMFCLAKWIFNLIYKSLIYYLILIRIFFIWSLSLESFISLSSSIAKSSLKYELNSTIVKILLISIISVNLDPVK